MTGRRAVWSLLAALLLVAAAVWWFLTQRAPPPAKLELQPARFADLPGWGQDQIALALPALLKSCGVIARKPPDAELGIAGFAADWEAACAAAAQVPAGDSAAVRAFFESQFQPFAASDNGDRQGLFTGYYEISLQGSREAGGRYTVPLYTRPADLVTVDLGQFRPQLKGQRIAGKVVGGALKPYPTRAEIDAGALRGRGLELVWLDDPIAAFFLQIQGSGEVRLQDGGTMRVGYAAQNGWPYVAIGRELIQHGALTRENVSMQSIRAWLETHPKEAPKLMESNPSYVFFRDLGTDGPKGAEGVVLTPGRSLAVDLRFVPLGVPVWLDATHPAAEAGGAEQPLRRLMVAQDTGGAIRGPVRGDVFWGAGAEAEAIAGRMKNPGRYWLLLPKPAAARRQPAS